MTAQLSGPWLDSLAGTLAGESLRHHRHSCSRHRPPLASLTVARQSTSSSSIQIVGSGLYGNDRSNLSSTLESVPEEFDWIDLEADLYHWSKTLRPVQWYPGHIAKTEKELKDQLKLMDVVIEVRDARIPMSTSHPQFGECGENLCLLQLKF